MAEKSAKTNNVLYVRDLVNLRKILLDEKLVTEEKLKSAEMRAQSENISLSKALIKAGYATEEQLTKIIGEKEKIPYIDIKKYTIERDILSLIPEKIARQYKVIPLFKIEDVLTVAMYDPENVIEIDNIARMVGMEVETVISSEESINFAIDQWYGVGEARKTLVDELAKELEQAVRIETKEYKDEIAELRLVKESEEAPIVKIVNSFIVQAMLEGASDIHLEAKKDHMLVRFRIDGFLYNRDKLPSRLVLPITSRVKILAGMDIAQRRLPQDGRLGIVIRNRLIDIRTSTIPSIYGENVVLRLLDKSKGVPSLSELGFSSEDLIGFKKVLKSSQGILLATGPTGSGKTTTIFAAVSSMRTEDKNIMTIENPIEYEIEGIVQSQINDKAGVTFASTFRAILRQDPDIIYVGEIRDLETAEIAVRASLTGHLVLSTLHTNDAVGAITRLKDIGIEAGLISDVLKCSFAQRLVRRICVQCKGKGCNFCSNIGYRGRVGIYEILHVNRDIRLLIAKNASEDEIRDAARKSGMKSLYEDGLLKVKAGITKLEEVQKATTTDEISE
jgi:type IV pilus assembly protein PilB